MVTRSPPSYRPPSVDLYSPVYSISNPPRHRPMMMRMRKSLVVGVSCCACWASSVCRVCLSSSAADAAAPKMTTSLVLKRILRGENNTRVHFDVFFASNVTEQVTMTRRVGMRHIVPIYLYAELQYFFLDKSNASHTLWCHALQSPRLFRLID